MNVRLGKNEYKHDERTLMMAKFVLPEIRVPAKWDFDKGRTPIPLKLWGNDDWGDCVIAGEANHLLRLERIEQRQTLKLKDDDVILRYKQLTGAKSPGDANDGGLNIIDAMRDWKNNGFAFGLRNYTIAAYGELDPSDGKQLRTASYALHGIHLGFWLPRSAQSMTANGLWDYKGESGPMWQPGSWGGHLVYSKAFDKATHEILTWGRKVKVTDAFIARYCDEAWAVVDNFDSWRVKQTISVTNLLQSLNSITSKVDQ